ncbi:MAG: hypothetical protein CVV23_01830 [Ignavibacteriae bacterium HGW-Ignavibacteriae-2]|jgi:uncharacterized protein YciI|nr:MAG: hypothetical protein CVV23_01830 [Ignavibacteriae bacterium HGW-Ignavibacteriae-2]
MKHFVVEITYKVSLEKIEDKLKEHRIFLQTGYENGLLLMSGPQIPRLGGIIIARAVSMEDIAAYFESDPFSKLEYATYQYIEFNPVNHQNFMKNWVE